MSRSPKRTYTDSYRLSIVEDYLSSSDDVSTHAIERKYSLSHGSLSRWLRIFGFESKTRSMKRRIAEYESTDSSKDLKESNRLLQLRIKELEIRLRDAEMARDAYSCMIDLAEETYHIKVRKNSAAK